MRTCYVGIDPSFRKDGYAVCIIDEDNTVDFKIFEGFLDFLNWVWDAPQNAVYCVENSYLQDATFDMKGSKAVVAKKSRHVGLNMAASEYTYQVLVKLFGDNAYQVSPRAKGGKWTDERIQLTFKMLMHPKITNYKGNKNEQDKRDAYQLALMARNFKKV